MTPCFVSTLHRRQLATDVAPFKVQGQEYACCKSYTNFELYFIFLQGCTCCVQKAKTIDHTQVFVSLYESDVESKGMLHLTGPLAPRF